MKVESPASSRAATPPAPTGGSAGRHTRWVTIGWIAFGLVLLVGLVLRFVVRSDLWLDEALSVNIARLPLDQLHEALKHDGAPPLYYLLLHAWMVVFGEGDAAVRALSIAFTVACLPLAWFAGRRLGGRTVAIASVIVLWTAPFAIRYSTETRMYSLEMFLVLAGYLALWRVLERPNLARMAVLALVTGALLYTQYWSFYLLAVVGLGLLWRAVRTGGAQRHAAISGIVALVCGFLVFVPWIPTFLYQTKHTGTPWGSPVTPATAIGGTLLSFAGGNHAEGITFVAPLVLLFLLAVFGRAVDDRRIEIDVRTVPGVRWEAAVAFATLLVGTGLSFLSGTAFQARYAAIVFPLFALVVAFGVTVFGDPRLRIGTLVLIVAFGFIGGVRNSLEHRTQAYQAAAQINANAKPGDLVVYCPDQLGPAVSRLVETGRGLKQEVFPTGGSPDLIDWVDYKKRNDAADPGKFAADVLQEAGNHDVWLVWAPGYKTFVGKCEALDAALRAQRPNAQVLVLPDGHLFEFQGLIHYPR